MHVLGGNSEGSSGYEITTTQFQQGDVPEPDHVSTITWAPGSIPFRRIPTPAVGGGAYTRALPRSVGDCQLRSDSDVSFPACPPYSLWGGGWGLYRRALCSCRPYHCSCPPSANVSPGLLRRRHQTATTRHCAPLGFSTCTEAPRRWAHAQAHMRTLGERSSTSRKAIARATLP